MCIEDYAESFKRKTETNKSSSLSLFQTVAKERNCGFTLVNQEVAPNVVTVSKILIHATNVFSNSTSVEKNSQKSVLISW